MEAQTAVDIIVPREMQPDERQPLIDALYLVRRRISYGAERKKSFVNHVIQSGSEHGAVLLHRAAGGSIDGYFAMQIVERRTGGAAVAIFRGECGAPGNAGIGDALARAALDRLIRYMLPRPGRPLYCLCSLAHPSSYALLSRFADITHTSPAEGALADADALMSELAAAFEREPDEHGDPFVFESGQGAVAPASTYDFLHLYENPAVRYFLATHPGSTDGQGLITLVPLSLGGMMRAAARRAGLEARH
ncbi:hypothetical protein [Sorangium cellulosum]|uniref:hypothetical protein n=1 Tax=Sorangium cellulosum TaxID=56 RepID=UPI001F299227|nr:hypothetical protein [Sorangium cellulosum]